jgi:hypothetical protein
LFAHLYIFIIFLSQLIREKSGKVGQNGWNRCNYWVSAGPVLKIKVGQNPKKVGQNIFFVRHNLTQSCRAQKKVGQTHFSTTQSGPKERAFVKLFS